MKRVIKFLKNINLINSAKTIFSQMSVFSIYFVNFYFFNSHNARELLIFEFRRNIIEE